MGRFKNGIVESGGFESAGGRGVLNQEILTNASNLSLIEYKGGNTPKCGSFKKKSRAAFLGKWRLSKSSLFLSDEEKAINPLLFMKIYNFAIQLYECFGFSIGRRRSCGR